jgi:hypothetical protein
MALSYVKIWKLRQSCFVSPTLHRVRPRAAFTRAIEEDQPLHTTERFRIKNSTYILPYIVKNKQGSERLLSHPN